MKLKLTVGQLAVREALGPGERKPCTIWTMKHFNAGCENHFEASERTAIPLFANNDLIVQANGNRVPLRNQQMEQFYSSLIYQAKDSAGVCGIIYCMYWIRAEANCAALLR